MTDYTNDSNYSVPSVPPVDGSVDQRVIDALRATRPWVRFMAVLGFISVGLMILASFFLMGVSILASGFADMNPAEGLLIGSIYIISALLYLIPSVYLWKYGSAIVRLVSDRSGDSLFVAVDSQRSFWKVIGIIALIGLILSLGFMIVAMMVGFFAAIMAA